MSFADGLNTIKNIFDNSVFNESSYAKLAEQYKIVIYPTNIGDRSLNQGIDVGIKGVIRDEISIGLNTEWGLVGFGSLVNNIGWIQDLTNIFINPFAATEGVGLFNAGITTRKYFLRSGYLEISPKFRVVNWKDDGMPLKAALLMLNFCVPSKGVPLNKVAEQLGGCEVADIVNIVGEKLETIVNVTGNLLEAGGKLLGETGSKVGSGLKSEINKVSEGVSKVLNESITSSPSTVRVKIGNYFDYDEMCIDSVNVNFSKHLMKTGPMWVDIDCKMSSRQALTVDQLGFRVNGKRVSYGDVSKEAASQPMNVTGTK